MLTVEDLHLRLGKRFALEGVGFTVAPGEIVAVLGPNGSGKSTLLRLVAGLVAPDGGSITWRGTVLSEKGRVIVPPERRQVGLLLQEGVLFPHLDVRGNVALGVGPDRSDEEAERLVSEALAAVQITHLGGAPVERLSGGEAQRVALARALAQRPSMMLLDEPFHSLDGPVKRAITSEVQRLVKARGLAAVLVTHDAGEAGALADRVLLLREGRKVQEGTLDAIYRAPADAWTARFLGEVASIDAAEARAAGVALPEGFDAPRAWFRPDALIVDPSGEGALEVTAVRRSCDITEVTVALPGGATLRGRCPGAPPAAGQRARARITWTLPPLSYEDPPA